MYFIITYSYQKGKISKNDFLYAIENLKIKMSGSDLTSVFEYLDRDQDNLISYGEFCHLCEERRRDIDPFEAGELKQDGDRERIIEEMDAMERMSNASQMYKGFKSGKIRNGGTKNSK